MLMRFDPFREFDRMAQQGFGGPTRSSMMVMDAHRTGETFVVRFDLPGVTPESIDLTVEKNVLTVSAERRFDRTEAEEVLVSERPQGRFSRQLFLGDSLDTDRIEATYDRGVLTLMIPVAESAKPRKVPIAVAASAPTPIDTSGVERGMVGSPS